MPIPRFPFFDETVNRCINVAVTVQIVARATRQLVRDVRRLWREGYAARDGAVWVTKVDGAGGPSEEAWRAMERVLQTGPAPKGTSYN